MLSKTILATALLGVASAHQNFHQFWVNDETPGYQVGVRMPPSNSPVTDVTSDDMACNVGGSKVPSGVETVAAAEGDTIKVQWDNTGHPGPITHFLYGPVDDASKADGIGAGWFKIDEQDQVAGKWAFEGRLEDLSDILNPMKGKFLPNTIETTFMHNDKEKKRAYYAFPVKRQTMHIQYWKDMLADAGFKESDIPKTWKAYFDFWCGKAQEGYRKKTGKRVGAVATPRLGTYGLMTYLHEGKQYIVVPMNGGYAAYAMP